MKFVDVEQFRIRNGAFGTEPGNGGAFFIPGPVGRMLRVIASLGYAELNVPWEHVSVSTDRNCPSWREMCYIKNLFWDKEETVMQLHPPESEWVNCHPHCLHLWRPTEQAIPLPPSILVGPKIAND
jgi:hypothetical protein